MQPNNQDNHKNQENHSSDIELRSEEFQEVLGAVPHWILRWGIIVLAAFTLILLIGSSIFKYPDIISAQIMLTGTKPPASIIAHSSGKLKELFVTDNQEVKTGDYLAVIDNSARTEDIRFLKNYLDTLPLNPLKGTLLHYGFQKSLLGDLGVKCLSSFSKIKHLPSLQNCR